MEIKRQMVSQKFINSKSYGTGNKMTHIAIHETANLGKTANAQAHANLQSNGNSRDASWHYQVDDKMIIQSFEDNIKCWHAGSGNTYSIGIEICVNEGADFKKAVANTAELVKHLMKKYNIPISNIVQHNYFTGKDCPTFLRNGKKGINWTQFKAMLSQQSKPNKPITTNKQGGKLMKDGLTPQRMDKMAELYAELNKKGLLKSDESEKLAKNDTLTVENAVYALTEMINRLSK